MITQDKGEWSEPYVFLKLLGEGVLYAADSELNKIENLYYPLIEIIRKENNSIKHYKNIGTKIKITDNNENLILDLPVEEFKQKANLLLETIKKSDSTFSIPKIEEFMKIIECTKVKADSLDKSDITLVLHDCKTYRNETFGFSIKSELGNPPTLLNPSIPTNFIYKIVGNLQKEDILKINSINSKSKIQDRILSIIDKNCSLQFYEMENEIFKSNLQMVDSQFPLIISELLKQRYITNKSPIKEIVPIIRQINPCNFNLSTGQKYYEHKIKNFLTDVALGMIPAKVWDGKFQATGGYIIVRKDGEILCYHIYNHNDFQEYLFNNTRLETPSATRYNFGSIYSKEGANYIKLNLQVRFI